MKPICLSHIRVRDFIIPVPDNLVWVDWVHSKTDTSVLLTISSWAFALSRPKGGPKATPANSYSADPPIDGIGALATGLHNTHRANAYGASSLSHGIHGLATGPLHTPIHGTGGIAAGPSQNTKGEHKYHEC
ncbi:hypothetical protein AMTR_s00046p00092170 [Amborella trichopoda]|uniref:Uncharacterized protein n=1 Tax=Amborella trichopoda TaxID=13333 RepID=U5D962_AMBTC|nr:hypothetical protein AMTR_s00046p00092170 [Amborella trichopoda]